MRLIGAWALEEAPPQAIAQALHAAIGSTDVGLALTVTNAQLAALRALAIEMLRQHGVTSIRKPGLDIGGGNGDAPSMG